MFGMVMIAFQINHNGLRKMFGMNRTKLPTIDMNLGKMYWNGKKFQMSETIGCVRSSILIFKN